MAWLVTGGHGMLGSEVRRSLAERGTEHTVVGRDDLDLLEPGAVCEAVSGHDVVVNCAAWTAVDLAETYEPHAFEINATAAGVLARACREQGALIVHVSTDYVFSGEARTPYAEDAPLGPRSAYGRTKAAGEWAVRAEAPSQHLVLRTGWLYGARGDCFPRTIARVAREKGSVDVVDDQFGQPTWARDVADLMLRLVEARVPPGTWHATSGGQTSWWEFAREVVASAGLDADLVNAVPSREFRRAAPRPEYSVLGHARFAECGLEPIGPWLERWRVAASEVLAADQL